MSFITELNLTYFRQIIHPKDLSSLGVGHHWYERDSMNPKPGMTTAKWIGGEVEQFRANLPSLVSGRTLHP